MSTASSVNSCELALPRDHELYKKIEEQPENYVLDSMLYLHLCSCVASEEPLFPSKNGHEFGKILINMGTFKAAYFQSLMSCLIENHQMERVDAESEELRLNSPDLIAQAKCEATVGEGDLILAQDVLVFQDREVIHKPEVSTKEELIEMMLSRLGEKRPLKFVVKNALAVENGQKRGSGISFVERLQFKVKPFCREELEQYVSEFNLEDLTATNGGFRWPHSIFISHIETINGVSRGEENFYPLLESLILSLLGSSKNTLNYVKGAQECLQDSAQEGLPPYWQRLIQLKDGELAEIREVQLSESDIEEISTMVVRNFGEHPNYEDLDPELKARYQTANNFEGTQEVCFNEDNISVPVVIRDDKIVGYCVLKKESEEVAEIRRLHTLIGYQGLGIGTILLDEVEQAAMRAGFQYVSVIASGCSDKAFFMGRGYNGNGRSENQKLKQEGYDGAVVHYLSKELEPDAKN